MRARELALASHPIWDEIAPELVPGEFRHPGLMDVEALRVFSAIRRRSGVPFRIISDHRPPARNAAAGGARQSAHMESPCCAVDLGVSSNEERFRIVAAALALGVERIGVYPAKHGGAGSVHLDLSDQKPAPRMWTEVAR